MADNRADKSEHAPGRRGSDVRHGVILGLGIGVIVLLIAISIAILGLTDYFATERPLKVITSQIIPEQIPPPPRLQSTPASDLHALRLQQQTLLESYGWVDKQAGVVHIPIERAMELLTEKYATATSQHSP